MSGVSQGRWRRFTATGLACLIAVVALIAHPAGQPRAPKLPPGAFGDHMEVVGYSDLGGHPAFKMAINQVNGRWLMYLGSFWERGWMIVDVTDPAKPQYLKWIQGPDNTTTVQMDWAEGKMETPLARIPAGRDFVENKAFEGGFYIWNLTDPLNPVKLGHWKSPGTHRNYYDGGRYVYATTLMDGFEGQILSIVDVGEPTTPKEVGRWWVPGQNVGAGEKPLAEKVSLHGPSIPIGNLLYLPYGAAGMVILDIKDVTKPQLVGQLDFSPPFHAGLTVHTVKPVPERGIAIVNSEAGMPQGMENGCHEAANETSIVDISDPKKPWLISVFPRPLPPPGYPARDFCDRGRFGPHNQNTLMQSKWVEKQGNIVYLTYFSAGLRLYDISDPRAPREIGYFIPPDPVKRYGPLPANALITQTEDVLVDTRGYIYITDRNQGMWILRYTGPKAKPMT
jgi:hypothetical protein